MQGVTASAPGKLVLAGEYAVLAGAPAIVAAMDRRVVCRVTVAERGHWQFVSRGFEARVTARPDALAAAPGGPVALAHHALQAVGIDAGELPPHLQIEIDSRQCYRHGAKLGLGSSAAALVALAWAFATLCGRTLALAPLIAAHRALQGGVGSGVDVAAAWHGGVVSFQRGGRAQPARRPAELHFAFAHAGWSTRTASLLARFETWRRAGEQPVLQRLVERAERVAAALDGQAEEGLFACLGRYADALQTLDEVANIGIFSPPHQQGRALAARHGVVYKPCGAGGGDMGIAIAEDAAALAAWREGVEGTPLSLIDLAFGVDGALAAPMEA